MLAALVKWWYPKMSNGDKHVVNAALSRVLDEAEGPGSAATNPEQNGSGQPGEGPESQALYGELRVMWVGGQLGPIRGLTAV